MQWFNSAFDKEVAEVCNKSLRRNLGLRYCNDIIGL